MGKRSRRKSRLSNIKPFTPIRRLLLRFDIRKKAAQESPAIGRKKPLLSSEDIYLHGPPDPVVVTPPVSRTLERSHMHTDASPTFSPNQSSIALQNEDEEENAIVITALNTVPFCCHEDLLTMSREQLIAAALTLNAKLPAVLQIDVSHVRSTSFIRHSIEMLVGIRPMEVPPAPKAVRSMPCVPNSEAGTRDFNLTKSMNRSPPTSPLARRSKGQVLYGAVGCSPLTRLVEEDSSEDDEELEDYDNQDEGSADPFIQRLMRKRRFSNSEGENEESEVDVTMTPSPTALPPSLHGSLGRGSVDQRWSPITQGTIGANSGSILGAYTPEALGNKMGRKRAKVDTAFVTTSRPRYRPRKDKIDDGQRVAGLAKKFPTGSACSGIRARSPRRPVAHKENKALPMMLLAATPTHDYRSFAAIDFGRGKDSPTSSFGSSLRLSKTSTPSLLRVRAKGTKRKVGEMENDALMEMGGGNTGAGVSSMDICG